MRPRTDAVSTRVDAELVRRGLARSRAQATALIRRGDVRMDGVVVGKASTPCSPDARITVEAPTGPDYASRAALKLVGALDALGPHAPRVEGADCLDLGASTGGFTDVLLRRGARHVLAVDVGHDQLLPHLRADPRVEVREGLNVRDLDRSQVPTVPAVVVADLSFISLRTVLPAIVGVIDATSDVLVMVKPQFEVGRERLGRGGVVRSDELRADAVRSVAVSATDQGLRVRAVIPSPLPGPSGNREYFLWLDTGKTSRGLSHAVETAIAWDPDSGTAPPVSWIGGEPGNGPERLVVTTTT